LEPVYRIVYLVHPKPVHSDYGRIDGAYASCWVKESVLEAADAAARSFLDEHGWDVEEHDETYLVNAESCPPNAEGREYFEQVQLDGLVTVFHTWPVGAPEEE
jgi:hypothetical protein